LANLQIAQYFIKGKEQKCNEPDGPDAMIIPKAEKRELSALPIRINRKEIEKGVFACLAQGE